MKISQRRNGSAIIFAEEDSDEVIAETHITSFTPTPGSSHCACGAPLRPWSFRRTSNGAELHCFRCHRVLGHLELEVEVHR